MHFCEGYSDKIERLNPKLQNFIENEPERILQKEMPVHVIFDSRNQGKNHQKDLRIAATTRVILSEKRRYS